jgi:hypothetical protein
MEMRPARLNAMIATLFALGSSCFVLGSVPVFINTVSEVADAVTYFVGSIFFTSASFLQLLQAQSPAMTGVEAVRQNTPGPVRMWRWLPHDRGWLAAATQFPGTLFFNVSTFAALAFNASVQAKDRYVWRPDVFGSTLFLVASVFGILAIGRFWSSQWSSFPWRIAWVNMLGSILFMASALASFVVPSSGDLLSLRITVAGTLLGAVCFLIGSLLMFPAWKQAVIHQPSPRPRSTSRPLSDNHSARPNSTKEST